LLDAEDAVFEAGAKFGESDANVVLLKLRKPLLDAGERRGQIGRGVFQQRQAPLIRRDKLGNIVAKAMKGFSLALLHLVFARFPSGVAGCQRIDQACTRDFGFIVTDGQGFFSEEKRDATSTLRPVADGQPEGFCKLIIETAERKIVGAHVFGEYSAEVIQMVAACMAAGMRVEDVAELQFAFPTFTEGVSQAAQMVVNQLGVRPMSRLWSSLGTTPSVLD